MRKQGGPRLGPFRPDATPQTISFPLPAAHHRAYATAPLSPPHPRNPHPHPPPHLPATQMWITMDRNGFINDIKRADSPARRAYVVLNHQQVQRGGGGEGTWVWADVCVRMCVCVCCSCAPHTLSHTTAPASAAPSAHKCTYKRTRTNTHTHTHTHTCARPQIHAARSFLPEDRVLALVPLVDYGAWKVGGGWGGGGGETVCVFV